MSRGKELRARVMYAPSLCAMSGSLKAERERDVLKGPQRFCCSRVLPFALFFHLSA